MCKQIQTTHICAHVTLVTTEHCPSWQTIRAHGQNKMLNGGPGMGCTLRKQLMDRCMRGRARHMTFERSVTFCPPCEKVEKENKEREEEERRQRWLERHPNGIDHAKLRRYLARQEKADLSAALDKDEREAAEKMAERNK